MISNTVIVGQIAFEPSSNQAQTAASIHVNVRRNFKKEGEQWAQTDKVICKALNEKRAKMLLERFSKGDIVVVSGRLTLSDDYKNKSGEEVKGDWELIIEHIDGPFVYKEKDDTNQGATGGKTNIPPAPAPAPITPPAPAAAPPRPTPMAAPPAPPASAGKPVPPPAPPTPPRA